MLYLLLCSQCKVLIFIFLSKIHSTLKKTTMNANQCNAYQKYEKIEIKL